MDKDKMPQIESDEWADWMTEEQREKSIRKDDGSSSKKAVYNRFLGGGRRNRNNETLDISDMETGKLNS